MLGFIPFILSILKLCVKKFPKYLLSGCLHIWAISALHGFHMCDFPLPWFKHQSPTRGFRLHLQGAHTRNKDTEYTWPLSCPQDQQESSDSSLQGTHTTSKVEHTRLPLFRPQATMWVTAEQSRPAATRHLSQSAGDGAPHSWLNSQTTKQVAELPPCD